MYFKGMHTVLLLAYRLCIVEYDDANTDRNIILLDEICLH